MAMNSNGAVSSSSPEALPGLLLTSACPHLSAKHLAGEWDGFVEEAVREQSPWF